MRKSLLLAGTASIAVAQAALAVELFNNGTFVTGTSPGGNTISVVPDGYDTFGIVAAGYNSVAPQRIADNFVITSGAWDLDSVTVYAYEAGGVTNTFSSAYVAIFDCDPSGTTDLAPRHGSLDPFSAPNAFLSQQPLNIYRVSAAAVEGTTRHVHAVTLDLSSVPPLPPGEYWVAFGLQGGFSDAVVATVPVTPVPAGADGLSWGRTRYVVPGRENFWQYADGSIATGEDPNLIQPYDHAFKLDGTMTAVNQWAGPGGGTFGASPGNWTGGTIPGGTDAVANFLGNITGASTVTIAAPLTLGKINFNDSDGYNLVAASPLTLESTTCAHINVFAGNHVVSGSVSFNGNFSMLVQPAASSLRIEAPVVTSGRVIKRGDGTATVNRVQAGTLELRGGRLAIAPNGTASGTSRVNVLKLDVGNTPRAKLDLNNNALVVDYSGDTPFASIRAQIISAYNGGPWDGNGITSSMASASFGLGYVEASALGSVPAIFGAVDADAVLVRLVRFGDANLDGQVNLQDFNALAANFGSTDALWHQGDFNYDGIINLADFNRLASNFGLSAAGPEVTPDDWAALAAAVPEPGAVGLLLGALPLGLRRRRGR